MDRYPDLVQVLTVPGATPDELAGPNGAVDLSKKINDEMAELVDKYPYRFAGGVAVLPVSDIDASLKEIDRAIKNSNSGDFVTPFQSAATRRSI